MSEQGLFCRHPVSSAHPTHLFPALPAALLEARPLRILRPTQRVSVSDLPEPMLDAISLSEEELGLLFSPTSNGGGPIKPGVCLGISSRKTPRMRVSSAANKRATSKTKTSSIKSTFAVSPARCGYRTGKCPNLQTIKRNGNLHKLCEFHRERANLNQKKLDRKKRLQRSKSTPTSASSCESVASEDDTQSVKSADGSPRTVDGSDELGSAFPVMESEDTFVPVLPTSLNEAPLALGCEELAIFCSLMTFDTSHRPSLSRDPPSAHTPCPQYTSIV